VIYGMGDSYKGNIRRKDLRKPTPYNTYVIPGLPPTPICMPGRASIFAVVHPADEKALYFVAKGDGSHQFSATLRQHNAAVRKYQLKK
ncbi:MAG TPA: endolytic transglycosylase MltG, partial [Chromatiaceae bacterium]|nr:endolytic transglycosylase MltG [Chromatiaceae bacterium]